MRTCHVLVTAALIAALSPRVLMQTPDRPFLTSELIFPLEHWHNHASMIVELPGGDLLVCWFHGSGERTADDVVVRGARLRKGSTSWSAPFLLADTPGSPDANPTMFLDPKKRLWLMWPTILANEWHTALMKYKLELRNALECHAAADDRELRADLAHSLRRHGQQMFVQHDKVAELAGLDRAAILLVEAEPGRHARHHAQRFLARNGFVSPDNLARLSTTRRRVVHRQEWIERIQ